MFRIIPTAIIGMITVYLYILFSRFNTWKGLNISRLTLLIILLLLMIPAVNFFGIWFLILLHIFQIGIITEIINLFLKRLGIKYWDILYNSCSLPIVITILVFCYGYYNINNIKKQINLIIKFFNLAELIYGNEKIGKFNVIVSSGFSGWGYPIRTAGHSEYVVINIFPKN